MNDNGQEHSADAIVWHAGTPTFRGLPVEVRTVEVAGISLTIVAMVDATHLLDQPDCARRFLDADVAPYGVELWPAAIMLAEYISTLTPPPRRSLEIGCGLGYVALIAARLGWTIVAGDHEPSSLVFARENARLNNIPDSIFQPFDWNSPTTNGPFDCILGADILYQINNHAPVLQCLRRLLAESGEVLISDPNRGVADRFVDAARGAGFELESIPARAPGPSGSVAGRILRLYRPRP